MIVATAAAVVVVCVVFFIANQLYGAWREKKMTESSNFAVNLFKWSVIFNA